MWACGHRLALTSKSELAGLVHPKDTPGVTVLFPDCSPQGHLDARLSARYWHMINSIVETAAWGGKEEEPQHRPWGSPALAREFLRFMLRFMHLLSATLGVCLGKGATGCPCFK